jgi:hypothetical protein
MFLSEFSGPPLLARAPVSRARDPNLETSATSTSPSWPTAANKRTFRALSVRTVSGEVRAAHVPSEIAQPYTPPLHLVVAGANLMITDTAPKGGYARPYSPCRIRAYENTPSPKVVHKGRREARMRRPALEWLQLCAGW